MTTNGERSPGLGFSVDGVHVDPGPYRAVVHRLVGGVFLADATAARRLMPSRRLHPLRFLPGRTLVMVNCTDADWHIGSLPPFRCANLLIAVVATPGGRPGPWVTPILTDASALRHRAGLVVLASVSTSRVLAEFNRAMLGWPGLVAGVRNDQEPGLERFTAADGDGPIVQVGIRPTGKPEEWGPTFWGCGVRGERVWGWRMDMAATTTQLRYWPGASRMILGEHPALARLRDLNLRQGGVIGSFHTDGTRVIDQPPFDVGPAGTPAPDPVPADPVEGRFLVADAAGAERVISAGHAALGINPAGNVVPTPQQVPGRPRSEGGRR